jgi:hypothetical protein
MLYFKYLRVSVCPRTVPAALSEIFTIFHCSKSRFQKYLRHKYLIIRYLPDYQFELASSVLSFRQLK